MQNIYSGFIPKDLLIKQAQPPAPTATPPSTPTPPKPALPSGLSEGFDAATKTPAPAPAPTPTPAPTTPAPAPTPPASQPQQDNRSWLTKAVHGVSDFADRNVYAPTLGRIGINPAAAISRTTAPYSQEYADNAFVSPIIDRAILSAGRTVDPALQIPLAFGSAGAASGQGIHNPLSNLDNVNQVISNPNAQADLNQQRMATNYMWGTDTGAPDGSGTANALGQMGNAVEVGLKAAPLASGVGATAARSAVKDLAKAPLKTTAQALKVDRHLGNYADKAKDLLTTYGKSTPSNLVERFSPLNALGRAIKGTGESTARNAAGAAVENVVAPIARVLTGSGASRSLLSAINNLAARRGKDFLADSAKGMGYSFAPATLAQYANSKGLLSQPQAHSHNMSQQISEAAQATVDSKGTSLAPSGLLDAAVTNIGTDKLLQPVTFARNIKDTVTGTGGGGIAGHAGGVATGAYEGIKSLGFNPFTALGSGIAQLGNAGNRTAIALEPVADPEGVLAEANKAQPNPLQDTQPVSTLPEQPAEEVTQEQADAAALAKQRDEVAKLPQPPQQFTPSPEALRQPATVPTREVEQHIRNVMMTHPTETKMIADTMGVGALTGLASVGKQLETIAKLPGGVDQFKLNISTPGTPEYNNALNNLAADYMREQGWDANQISQLIRQNPLRYPTAVEQDGPLPPLEAPQPQPEVAPQPRPADTGGNLGLPPADAPVAQGQNPFVNTTPTPPAPDDSYSPDNPPGYLTGGTGGKATPTEQPQPTPEAKPEDTSFWGRITKFWNEGLDDNGRLLVGLGLGVTAVTTLMNLFGGDDDEDGKGGGGSWFSRILPFLGIGAAAWGLGGGSFSQLPSLTTMGDNISSIFKQAMIATFTPKSKIRLYDKNMRRVYA